MPVLANPKHELFAQALALGVGPEEAYRRAGYKPDAKNANRLTKNDGVRTRVDELLTRAAKKVEASIERTLEEITRLAFADISLAVEWKGSSVTLKDSASLPPEVRAAISEVKQTKDGVSIKFHSKTAALDMLGKHFGVFKEKLEVAGKDGGPIQIEAVDMSPLEVARRMAFLLEQGRRLIPAKVVGETPNKP